MVGFILMSRLAEHGLVLDSFSYALLSYSGHDTLLNQSRACCRETTSSLALVILATAWSLLLLMAPRVKSKKVVSKKMGAALKVLTQYGFKKDGIVSTIKQLIEEYGGEDGWVFIEDNGYQVVVDSILDKQNSEQMKGGKEVGESSSNPHVEQYAHNSEREHLHAQDPLPAMETQDPKKRREPCYGWISEEEED